MFKKSCSILNCNSRRLLSLQKPNKLDLTKHEKILLEPFEYIQKAPSEFHGLMATGFDPWLRVPEEKFNIIQDAMQTFMTWTILIDDIQDQSSFRYGVPSAHKVYGVGLALNASVKAMLIGEKQVKDLGHPLAPQILVDVLEKFFLGQGIDIYWRDNFIVPTADEHIEMTRIKSGSWFALPVALMQLFSTNKTDYVGLATNIGIYHHMVDDYYNLFHPKALAIMSRKKHEKHETCSDITECKFTLAIIHALQIPDVAEELANILKQRTSDPKLQNRAIELLKKHNSDDYMRDVLSTIEADIRTEIAQLGGNETLTAVMDNLTIQNKETPTGALYG